MLRAHRQVWAWQDEWHGLSMEDIRQIERQTQEALKKTMGANDGESQGSADEAATSGCSAGITTPQDSAAVAKTIQATLGSIEKTEQEMPSPPAVKKSEVVTSTDNATSDGEGSPEDSPTELNLR